MRNQHKFGQGRPLEECIVCHFEIGYLELHVIHAKVLLGLERHRESNLPN
jgi:hypothetical protein